MAHVYFWHSFKDSGFPARVNHAAAPIYDSTTGKAAIISVGGYHADVQERLNTPDENRTFKSTPIDMHKLDPGKFQVNQDCKIGKVTKCCWVCAEASMSTYCWDEFILIHSKNIRILGMMTTFCYGVYTYTIVLKLSLKNFKGFRNVQKSIETSGDILVL